MNRIIRKIAQELSVCVDEVCQADGAIAANYELTSPDYDAVAYVLDGVYEQIDLEDALESYQRYPHYRDECAVLSRLIEICKENS